MDERELIISKIIEKEWEMFRVLHNIGGPAECQNNKPEFEIMRKGQWDILDDKILKSYLEDLENAILEGRNLLQEKYIKMMEHSSPEEYEKVKHVLKEIRPGQKVLIKKIEDIYLEWGKEFENRFPKFSKLCRPLDESGDLPEKASVQTYLKGELYSYSLKTLLFYHDFVLECYNNKRNLIYESHLTVVKQKGFEDIESVEKNLNI